jgi:hypothetical protein
LSLVVRVENDADVFDCYDNCQSPDDERQSTKKVVIARRFVERRGVDIERARRDITVYDANGLVSKAVMGGLDQSVASQSASAYIINFHP